MASELTTRQAVVDMVAERLSRVAAGHDAPEDADIENAVDAATYWFSRHKPRIATDATLDGDGSTTRFLLSSLTPTWVDGLSSVKQIEHPINTGTPTFLDRSEWDYYPEELPTHIRFHVAPASGTSNIAVTFQTVHSVDESSCTPQEADREALVYLACCLVARMYQTRYGQTTDSTIDADSVDYRAKSDEWRQIAEDHCHIAGKIAGVDFTGDPAGGGSASPPVGRRVDIDPDTLWGSLVWRGRKSR